MYKRQDVTSVATTPVSESAFSNFPPIFAAEAGRPFLTAQTGNEAARREGDDDGTGCSTPCSSDSATSTVTPYRGIEVATVTTGTVAASQLTTMEAAATTVQQISADVFVLPRPPPTMMTDDHIIDYFVRNPEQDGQAWAARLLNSGHIAADDAAKLFCRVEQIKHILSTYAQLIIRRSQIRDGATAETADAFLLNELYRQFDQKM